MDFHQNFSEQKAKTNFSFNNKKQKQIFYLKAAVSNNCQQVSFAETSVRN